VKHTISVAAHTGYWGTHAAAFSLLLLMLRGPHAASSPLTGLMAIWPVALIALGPGVAAFYASYGPLFSRSLGRKKLNSALAGGAGISLAAAALGLLLAMIFFGVRQPVFSQFRELAALTVLLAGLAAVQVAIALLVRGFAGWWRTDSAASPEPSVEAAPLIASDPLDVIFVKTEQRLEKVRLDEILVIEGQRDYRRIHTPTRRIMTLQTFAEFERQLKPDVVCRVHKSYMVGVRQIDAIERGRIAVQGLTVPISETYRERFFALIGQR
jgi:DNA-binding LytR/AlgR family response regulator